MKNMSKSIFLNAVACPTLGWLLRSEQYIEGLSDKSPTLAEQFRIEQGIEVENRARQLFPNGILVEEKQMQLATEETRALMSDPDTSVIFNGAFLSDGFSTRADVLQRTSYGTSR